MKRRVFGFDLGIASVGWAVVDFKNECYDLETGEVFDYFDKDKEELLQGNIVDCGVRCFEKAETEKGKSWNEARRNKRLSRRSCRRKARRMYAIKNMFVAKKLVKSMDDLDLLYAS